MHIAEQFDFLDKIPIKDEIVKSARKPKQKEALEAMTTDDFLVALNAALAAENLSFLTYSLMLAVRKEQGLPLATLAERVGQSYWAVRGQANRTPWFVSYHDGSVRVKLAPGALGKLARVLTRIPKQ